MGYWKTNSRGDNPCWIEKTLINKSGKII